MRLPGRRFLLKGRFAALGARQFARTLWRKRRPVVELESVQRRIELLLTAMYGHPVAITSATPTRQGWISRITTLVSRDPRAQESTPGIDSVGIQLPSLLSARDGNDATVARYRLLAIEQAERLERGTATHAGISDQLERDLYLLREGAIVDAAIARAHPGLAIALEAERAASLARRPRLEKLTRPERDVELMLRDVLSHGVVDADAESHDAATSLEWARAKAAGIRRDGERYRGLPPTSLWGVVRTTPSSVDGEKNTSKAQPSAPGIGVSPKNSSTGGRPSKSGDGGDDDAQQSAESKATAPADKGANPDADNDDAAGAPTEEVSPLPDESAPNAHSGIGGIDPSGASRKGDDDPQGDLPPAILYDEWNADTGRYVSRAASVRLYEAKEMSERWSTDVLDRHAALVRQVRHQFERLRARRMLLGRQRAGDDLDIAACVNAIVDRRIGHTPDDRLYLDSRPARRGTAISLLVDVSGSTETRVTKDLRIIDLERIALLLASEALDALGELYAIYAFAGKRADNVAITAIKDFGERSGVVMRRRVAGLQSGGFTRLGAPVRHATRELARQSAGHRLLLILSDGRPNDLDQYQGPYGVEDSRQAIMEARASGVFPFCLTVDHAASEYLPRIFGATGHTILQRPEQLPRSLVGAVRALIGQR